LVVSSFLYYARVLDSTILLSLNYTVTYLQVHIQYYTSNIILLVNSNAAYLVMLNMKGRIVGYF